MSSVTIAPAPAAAAGRAARSRQRSVRSALARLEGRRLLTHPLFVLGMAASALRLAVGTSDGGEHVELLGGSCFFAFGAGVWVFLVACLAASRERRDETQDLYGAQPVTPRLRTQAAVLSLAWAGLAGTALIGVATVVLAGPDGALVVNGEGYSLRPLELAQGPLLLVMVGAFGLLVGSWTQHTYPAVIGALVLFSPLFQWQPWVVFNADTTRFFEYSDYLSGASLGWHLTALIGLTALAVAGSLARHDRRPRVALLALAGLGAAVAGTALGLPPVGFW